MTDLREAFAAYNKGVRRARFEYATNRLGLAAEQYQQRRDADAARRRAEAIRLHDLGWTRKQIASALEVHKSTVGDYLRAGS